MARARPSQHHPATPQPAPAATAAAGQTPRAGVSQRAGGRREATMLSRPPPSAGAQPFPLRITAWRLLPPAMTRRLVGDHGSIGNRAPSAQIHGENINCELHHRHTDFSSWPVRLHISPPSLLSPHSPPGTSRHRHPPSVLSIPFCVSACFPTVLSAVLPFLHRPFDTSRTSATPPPAAARAD